MALSLSKSIHAMAPGLSTYVVGKGGVEPYSYSVAPGGAGGTINASTGLYTAPATINEDPSLQTDTIIVTDYANVTAQGEILITDILGLFCDILQTELELDAGRVYIWNQRIQQPTDSGLFIAVRELISKPFANTTKYGDGVSGLEAEQSVNMLTTLQVDLISRGPEARLRQAEFIMALNSDYAQSQQERNSFYIGKLPPGGQFTNLSMIDGAAIPFRYSINVNIQYFVKKVKPVSYFDDFSEPGITTEP